MDASIIYLVGFMGAGKSSVGRCLARLLGWTFLDLDTVIEERAGIPIREIFSQRGEARFREIERTELAKASRGHNLVVALGGGAFCSETNQEIVKASGISVWLDAPMDLLVSRCAPDGVRPLFTNRAEMEALLCSRVAYYAEADVRLDVTDLSIDAAAREVIYLCSARKPNTGKRPPSSERDS